jgi:hypothetical protein
MTNSSLSDCSATSNANRIARASLEKMGASFIRRRTWVPMCWQQLQLLRSRPLTRQCRCVRTPPGCAAVRYRWRHVSFTAQEVQSVDECSRTQEPRWFFADRKNVVDVFASNCFIRTPIVCEGDWWPGCEVCR